MKCSVAFITIVCLLIGSRLGSTKWLYVVPDGDVEKCRMSQENYECHSLAYYMNCSSQSEDCSSSYFNSNETYLFWKGRHRPLYNALLKMKQVENLSFIASRDDDRAIIDCNGESVGFVFHECSDITVENIVFLSCIRTPSTQHGHRDHALATLAFHNGVNLNLTRVILNGSVDEALYVHNIQGVIGFKEIVVINSKSTVWRNTNVIYNSKCNESESLEIIIKDSVFSRNHKINSNQTDKSDTAFPNSFDNYPLAAGLSITLKCLRATVQIDNVTMNDNRGGNGGNLALIFHNTASTPDNVVTIKNCVLESGVGELGGGLFVEFIDGSDSEEALCLHSPNKSHQLLLVQNTTFNNNAAVYAGGAVYLKQKQSQASCSIGRISFVNCTFRQNFVKNKGFGGIALHSINYPITNYKHHGIPQFKIIVQDCNFWENYAKPRDIVVQSGNGVIFSKADTYFELVNANISNNNSSGILAIGSNIILSGNISIENNRASSGGGMLLCENAIVYLNHSTVVTITQNYANHTGGGISVETQCLQSRPMCFFQLTEYILRDSELINSLSITVQDNVAGFAGHNLFGGSVDHCFMLDGPKHKPYSNQSIDVFKTIFHIPNTTSSITSEPHQICLCTSVLDSQPIANCYDDGRNLTNHEVYPGESFTVSAVLVGQLNGIVPGTVQAHVKRSASPFATLKVKDRVQKLGRNSSCGCLTYTVYTNESKVQLELSAQHSGDVSGYEKLNQLKKLTINVTIKNCPPGFALLENNDTISCDCVELLKHRGITCNIEDRSIYRDSNAWIGYCKTTKATLFHFNCPFDYCIDKEMYLRSEDTIDEDKQCDHHRTGILCGACIKGRSAIVGSNKCMYCSNYWLFMLIVMAASGALLVFLLSALNITITGGTLSGILFYCNVVNSNSTIYFEGSSHSFITRLLKVFVSALSLNAGGASVCLYDGLDAYALSWLSFLYPFYIWLLAGLIICLGHKYNWVVRRNSVKVLATLIILSYSTLLASVIEAIQPVYLQNNGATRGTYHWLKDGNVRYFHGKHIPLVIFASSLGLLLLPFTFCLLCISCLLKVSHHAMFSWVNRLKPFFDAYTGPFTTRGRFWTGLLLLARILIYSLSATNFRLNEPSTTIGIITAMSVILLFIASVLKNGLYKRRSFRILEQSLLLNLGIISTVSVNLKSHKGIIVQGGIGVAFVTFIGIICYHVRFFKWTKKHVRRACLRVGNHKWLPWQRDCRIVSVDDLCDTSDFPPLAQFDQSREPLLD